MEFSHLPVMPEETINALNLQQDGLYLDCTLGGGGHTKLILRRLSPKGRVIGIDRDSEALEFVKSSINDERLTTVKSNYLYLDEALKSVTQDKPNGILFDLGVSSYQLDNPQRGFSYIKDAPLDMRMDTNEGITAFEVVNGYSEQELTRILFEYGEEKFARKISARICEKRAEAPIKTTLELADIISAAIPPKYRYDGGNPCKRSFQAIRIEVNGELTAIAASLFKAADALASGGVLAVISFHSLEDRIVKNSFTKLENPCTCPRDFPVCVCGAKPVVKIITKKPILPSQTEIQNNPRSHSAKLRVCVKL